MTPKPSLLRAHYARLARLWPADPLRPHLPFQHVLLARRDDAALADPPPAAASQQQQQHPQPPPSSSLDGDAVRDRGDRPDQKDALAQHSRAVNALYALLDDRFARKYPLPRHLLEPESNPAHYTRLIEDIAAAPRRSHTTSWWIWIRGKVRFE